MTEIITKLKNEHNSNLQNYLSMKQYYEGEHDILNNYPYEVSRSNTRTVINMVGKFIEEEIAYCFGYPISYVSKNGNENALSDIDYNLYHWDATHNQELMRQTEIYGEAYELYYINRDGEFCARILNPTNAIILNDEDNIPQILMHFYAKPYDKSKYYDIYYPNKIEVYKDDVLIDTISHIFKGVPVSVCRISKEQTIYSKIKNLNDSLNLLVSDQINIISDYRNCYLVISGAEVDEETAEKMKTKGILNITSKDGSVDWLIKNLNDAYIQNMITEIKDSMYSICNHIDGNERLQSNTSGVALRTRLVFLEQRCKMVFDAVSDTINDRIRFLFEYLNLKNKNYDWKDIAVTFNPCVPQDLSFIANVITQLGDKISLETALAQIPFVENPILEMEKIKKERTELEEIDLDKIEG